MRDVGTPFLRDSSFGQLDGARGMNGKDELERGPNTALSERRQRQDFAQLCAKPCRRITRSDENIQGRDKAKILGPEWTKTFENSVRPSCLV